jgi:subtilisin family serine protease
MSVEDGRAPEVVADEISHLPDVEWSQPLNHFEMQGRTPSAYNDRLYPAQPVPSRWNLASMHKFATGRGTSIAIVDSRIDTTHPDLVGLDISIEDFVPGNRLRAESHGTGVAGIIAARPNNVIGIAGVAPGARIFGLRACWERTLRGTTVCDSLSLAKALSTALERKADVVNLSLTGPRDRLLTTLLQVAMSRGMTIVAAVDEIRPEGSFPASVEGVVRVGDESLSARGGNVYIAPGLDIPTTQPEGKWNLVNGSSYATAHVSGLAALLKQLSGPRRSRMVTATAFGPVGPIDACAAIARLSELDVGACNLHH